MEHWEKRGGGRQRRKGGVTAGGEGKDCSERKFTYC